MGTNETAEGCPMQAEPQQQHQWLEQLIGEWAYEAEAAPPESGEAPEKVKGTETVRSLGGLWVVGEGHSGMPGGGEMNSIITLGYDPLKGRYVGTFVASMMTHLWVYDGELDATQRVLTLNADGPACDMQGNPTDKPTKFKDVIEIKNDNERTLTGYVLDDDGQWQTMMTAHYRRKQ